MTSETKTYKRFFTRKCDDDLDFDVPQTDGMVNCILYGTTEAIRFSTTVFDCLTIIDRGEKYPAGRYYLMLATDEFESDNLESLEKHLKEWMRGEYGEEEITFETITNCWQWSFKKEGDSV